ncbi:hypothetical protein AQUCO_00400382v1 [Aquilegia coerulea]|uniref:F-box associated beta-propeller type 3 domain-containing protein n=1 Tax=Aquilegia coerulea TaxID=218851 RepID=A0A2G5EUQ0_AQUCA|nr:hypothetical protein AQUCO_00400382v1 [Aquilegia coerulea]
MKKRRQRLCSKTMVDKENPSLPDDILIDIFSRMPVMSLLQCTKKWRKIRSPGHLSCDYSVPCVNGAFHYTKLSNDCRWDDDILTYDDSIRAFDVGSEKFRKVPLNYSGNASKLWLGVLNGCLSSCVYDHSAGNTEIWLMKDYGVKESWTKLFTVCGFDFEPLVIRKNGEVLLKNDTRDSVRKKYIYKSDPIYENLNIEDVQGIVNWTNAFPYVESLISVASFSGGLTQIMKDNKKKKR